MDPGASVGGNRFVVVALLGEGSQGSTYAATEAETGRAVAIKRFDVRGARSWKDVELAEREARVLATLDHPLVPRYIEHFEEGGALYLVMDRVEGETLEAIRKRGGPVPEAEVRRFLACADSALAYLHGHSSPVVHRDVKPSNVVRRADGSYVLVDFGAVSEQLVRRGSSTIVGTLGYMAPEQLQGRALPASDVYAVGATALAALVGLDPDTMPHRGLRIDVRAALKGRASPELALALERMLEPDPDLRARSIAAALEGAMTGARDGDRAEPGGEEAMARSLRKLLWALWGIGWVIVPLVCGELLKLPVLIPIVMFGWLSLNLIVGWHRSAILRALLRQWSAENATPADAPKRVEVGVASERQKLRVQASDREPEEIVEGADGHADDERARRQQR